MPSPSKPSAPRLPSQAALPASDLHVLPRDLGSLFAHHPLIAGESENEYNEFLSKVTSAVAPTDIIEAVWVKDIVDLIWESQRLRRLKASLLMAARKQAVMRLLEGDRGIPMLSLKDSRSGLVSQWLVGDKAAEKRLSSLLAERGLTLNLVMAEALTQQLRRVMRIDQMIASPDARRNKTLSEVERRREAIARRLRMVSADITDVA